MEVDMAKGFCAHRVVVRSADDVIVHDEECHGFAEAEPVWIDRQSICPPGGSVALQHGARIMKWWPLTEK
jgi:hypothetical protein